MKKAISVIALAMCFVFAISSFAMAATKPTDSVQWNSGAKCTPVLSISGSTAKCKLYVTAENPNHSITATLMLQKEKSDGNYENVYTWSKITGNGSVNFSDSYSPVTGSDYRLKAIVYVTGSGGTDTIVRFSN